MQARDGGAGSDVEPIKKVLRWATDTLLKLSAHGGVNTSTPHDAKELHRPEPPEYRP